MDKHNQHTRTKAKRFTKQRLQGLFLSFVSVFIFILRAEVPSFPKIVSFIVTTRRTGRVFKPLTLLTSLEHVLHRFLFSCNCHISFKK